MAYYDPKNYGAKCDQCVLHGRRVVPPVGNEKSEFIVIADCPTVNDERIGTPLVGQSGKLLDGALESAGLPRREVRVTTLILCRPDYEGDLDKTLRVLKAENLRRARIVKKWRTVVVREWKRYEREVAKAIKNHAKLALTDTRSMMKYTTECERIVTKNTLSKERIEKANTVSLQHNMDIFDGIKRGKPRTLKVFVEVSLPEPPEFVELPQLVLPQPESVPAQPPELPRYGVAVEAPTPVECCSARFNYDTQHARTFLLLGKHTLRAVAGPEYKKPMDEQGFPIKLSRHPATNLHRWALSTLTPGAIQRGLPHYIAPFRLWVNKIVKIHIHGPPKWKDPSPFYTPVRVGVLIEQLLAEADKRIDTDEDPIDVGWDVETGGISVASALRVTGLSWGDVAVELPHRRIDGTLIKNAFLWKLLERTLQHPKIAKVAHNGVFDCSVIQMNGITVSGPRKDTLLVHHAIESEMPHSLSFLSSVTGDGPSWKSLGGGTHGLTVQDYNQLMLYNGIDCSRTVKLAAPLHELVDRDPVVKRIYDEAMLLQPIVVDMTCNGILLDSSRKQEFIDRFTAIRDRCMAEVMTAINVKLAEVGPGERDVYYKALLGKKSQLPEPFKPSRPRHSTAAINLLNIDTPMSKSGDRRSTAEDELALRTPHVDETARRFIGAKAGQFSDGSGFLGWTSAGKACSTFVENIEPCFDGRVRASWKMHGTTTGRWACDNPNLMNIPEWLRAMYIPAPGHQFVAADYSAIELWIVGIYTQARGLLKALQAPDPHTVNAEALFQLKFPELLKAAASVGCPRHTHAPIKVIVTDAETEKLANWGVLFPELTCDTCRNIATEAAKHKIEHLLALRKLAKSFVYAVNYQAAATTIHIYLRAHFPTLQLVEVMKLQDAWNKANPEIKQKAIENMNLFASRGLRNHGVGWLESPISGRRRFWTGKPLKITDVANYPIQSGAADVINSALIKLYPKVKALGGKLLWQVHDCLGFEVPDQHVIEVGEILKNDMPGRHKFHGIAGEWSFPVELKTGMHWDEV